MLQEAKAVTLRSEKQLEEPKRKEKALTDESYEPEKETEKAKAAEKEREAETPPQVSVPFPQRIRDDLKDKDKQFSKFLQMFRKLHINIPFAEAIAQMPKYAKFLKEIISNKKKLEEFELIGLSEECSAVVLKKLPLSSKTQGVSHSLALLATLILKRRFVIWRQV